MTTGVQNEAFGRNSQHNVTTGSFNVSMGTRSLESATTSSSNTAIGSYALLGQTGGTGYNTAVGWQAGHNTTSLTTGCQNVFLGSATHGSSATAVCQIVIGHSVAGKGNNTGFLGANSGIYQGNNSSSWSTTSDRRIKKNIADNTVGLEIIRELRVRNFEYRTPDEITEVTSEAAIKKEGVQIGLIAQEALEVLPEIVKQETTGVYSVDPDNLTWYLINAIKELDAENTLLKTRLEALEAHVGIATNT